MCQNNLGNCYSIGRGVPQNIQKALYWWRKAAAQDNAIAQFFLGVQYYTGNGVEKDEEQAFEWWEKSAEQGYEPAMEALATKKKNTIRVDNFLPEDLA